MKKFILALSLVLVCTVVLCGCGKDEKSYDYDLSEYVTLGEYPEVKVDMDEIYEHLEEEMESLASKYEETEEITDRAAIDGDTVNIDYVGKVDGKEFEGGKATGSNLILGSDTFIPGFEDGIIGKKIGETFDLNLVFPEEYKNNPDLEGKDVVFTVTLNSITATITPELTDVMVADSSEYNTVAEFKEATCKNLLEEHIWTEYLESCEVLQYPDKETRKYYDNMVDNYNSNAVMSGYTLEDFVKMFGFSDVDAFLEYVMQTAMATVKQELVIYYTAETYDIEISDEEYKTRGEKIAKDNGYETLKELEEAATKEGVEIEIYKELIIEKAYAALDVEFEFDKEEEKETEAETEAETEPAATEAETGASTEPAETTAEPAETSAETSAETAAETTAETTAA